MAKPAAGDVVLMTQPPDMSITEFGTVLITYEVLLPPERRGELIQLAALPLLETPCECEARCLCRDYLVDQGYDLDDIATYMKARQDEYGMCWWHATFGINGAIDEVALQADWDLYWS